MIGVQRKIIINQILTRPVRDAISVAAFRAKEKRPVRDAISVEALRASRKSVPSGTENDFHAERMFKQS